jgi:hypothetical protein
MNRGTPSARRPGQLLGTLLFVALPLPAVALEVVSLDTAYREQAFHIGLVATLDAPLAAVERVLRDYESYPQLDPRITEARILERSGPTELLLATRLRACAGIFCRNVGRVERVEEGRHELIARTLADRSNLRSGYARTILTAERERTRVRYEAHLEPAFWVPRLLAAGLALRTLENATLTLFENIEQRAAQVAGE